ncbi:Ribonuclease H-like superfamily [Sesbania bispinosa]|nr:Ribonuclease H-like superfamily [Sesbania bispinosa]
MDRLIVQVRESVDRILISNDNRKPTAPIQQHPASKWSAPPTGRYKFNTDAACITEGSWGIGIVVRDSEGFVLAAATRHIETLNDATLAEAVGIKFALQLALDLSFHDIIVESDCKRSLTIFPPHLILHPTLIWCSQIAKCSVLIS